jgi:cytochrome c oxidase subunit II
MRLLADGILDPQGPAAERIADLWWIMLGLGVVVFVVFGMALALGLFRRDPRSDDGSPRQASGVSGRWFAIVGVVLPAVIVIVVLVATLVAMRAVPNSTSGSTGALEIEVIAHQWWWEVRYPEDGFTTANELHIPVGRPVNLRLSATDVIHSFWVPRLSGKVDMLPDGTNTMVLEADVPGEHSSQCAEFCGIGHANMALTVVAHPEQEFMSWVAARQRPAGEPSGEIERRGLAVFMASECADCHTIRGASEDDAAEGPDLTHFADRPDLGATFVPNTRANLADWITDPHEIKPGVKMPGTELSDEELDSLLDYLESLE